MDSEVEKEVVILPTGRKIRKRLQETYEKAKAKTRKACDTSNLDTSDEEESRRSRCARRKRNLSQELQFLEEQPSRNQNKSPPYPDFEEEPIATYQMLQTRHKSHSNTSNFRPPTPKFISIIIIHPDKSIDFQFHTSRVLCDPFPPTAYVSTNNQSINQQCIKYMRTVGGADIGQCVNNILHRLMIDELAMQFSYTGRASNGNTKTPFHGSEISKCILIAIQKLFGEIATEVKYGLLASKWLQQARTRVLGKTKSRETTPHEAQIEDNNI
ncbi:uncharacterized protein LOC111059754 isoform X1 [Nilaparvata lugens]|uniref:uncharacterized protein LOC111059754 isoform X1 n=1 Tax=Nilaparvata lugens TaxID=108931 RepID=UPI00193C8BE9|nr:uncharacterized protein LOC111059754 isoform X1 [Nilaparvata lugens]XP_039294518.1 uncharacterized protein LOC111059754 isoform X1 [Nilaparvata lugens]